MIEGEDVFGSAQETGYRLCSHPGSKPFSDSSNSMEDKLFNAHWDACDSNRVFLCAQDGTLKILDTNTNVERKYQIQFRPQVASESNIIGTSYSGTIKSKTISYHWDKIITIPDRPDEIIFLLGVTKSLYYTALPGTAGPYPDEPFLARDTRYDFSDFIYGTPVMELWSHESRITSIAVSQFGHILASGDESGAIKLLLLRTLDDLSITLRAEVKEKKTSAPVFQDILPDYRISINAHNGPVFSMKWVDVVLEGDDRLAARAYCLATGSIDRSVKLWRVTCSTRLGIQATIMMKLDTLSTHILCLNSYVDKSMYNVNDDRVTFYKNSQKDSAQVPTVYTGNTGATDGLISVSRRLVSGSNTLSTLLPSNQRNVDVTPYKILLVDKIEIGTTGKASVPEDVYIAGGTNVGTVYVWKIAYKDLIRELARYYDPLATINHVVLDNGKKLHSLIQSSDAAVINVTITSCVDTNRYDYQDDGNNTYKSIRAMIEARNSRTKRIVVAASDTVGYVRTHCEVDLNKVEKGPITLCGEASYSSAVVSCVFRETDFIADVYALERYIDSSTDSTAAATAIDSTLITNGSSMFICTSDGTMQLIKTDALTALSGLRADADAQIDMYSYTDRVIGRGSQSLLHDDDDAATDGSDAAYHVVAFNTLPSYQPPAYNYNDTTTTTIGTGTGTGTTTTGTAGTSSGTTSGTVTITGVGKSRIESIVSANQSMAMEQKKKKKSSQHVPANAYKHIEPASSVLTGTTSTTVDEGNEPVARCTLPVPAPMPTIVSVVTAAVQTAKPSAEGKKKGVSIVEPTSTPSLPHKQQLQQQHQQQQQCVDGVGHSSYPVSELATTGIHSSRYLLHEMNDIVDALDNDDISISTIHTTSTDREVAAKIVSQRYSYRNLTQLTTDVNDPRLIRRKKTCKQIDSEWMARKAILAPTTEDLSILIVPDPYVHVTLKASVGTGTTGSSSSIKAKVNQDTLLTEFTYDIDCSDAFTVSSNISDWRYTQELHADDNFNRVMTFTSQRI